MNRFVSVLFIGIGPSRIPTFIERRIARLVGTNVKPVLLGADNISSTLPSGVSIEKKIIIHQSSFLQVLFLSIRWIFAFPSNIKLWRISSGRYTERIRWCLENFPITRIRNIDVIHSQWLLPEISIKMIKKFFPDTPLIVSARGSQVTVYPTRSAHILNRVRYNFKYASWIHCVSNDIAKQCIALGGMESKIFVNYNGIDLKRFKPSDNYSIREDALKIVSTGALIWRKGYLFQLQILKELLNKQINSNLYILGQGDDLESLLYMAHRLGIKEKVFFMGQKATNEVIELLQCGDLYLTTSAAEGLPNSVVEAAACGLPVVAFECEGISEAIEDNVTGYIIKYGDVQSAVEKIMGLTNVEKRNVMGMNARERAERLFNEDFWVGKMVEFYNRSTFV